MKLALNGATTMRASLETDVQAAVAAGFDYVEIWKAKLGHGSVKDLFRDANVRPLSINSIEHITFRDAQAYEGIKQECRELSRIAAEIECPYIVVVPGRLPGDKGDVDVVAESVPVLAELCDIAAEHGVALGFEFLGQADCSVQTLDVATEIVRETARDNVGLVIDSFHFYAGGSNVEMIEKLDPRLIYIFHINDAEDRPRAQLEDRHRLLPGLGILPLREMMTAFRKIGYDDVASVEIFRPEYWERDPLQLARDAKVAAERIVCTSESES